MQAYCFDINNTKDFDNLIKADKLPEKYEYIISNPPWIVASSIPNSPISLGVYDEKGKML